MAQNMITVSKRKFNLAFTMDALSEMSETIDGFSIDKLTELVRAPKTLVTILYILAKQGEMLEGRSLDVDRAWFGCHLKPNPNSALRVQTAVFEALTEGLRMETEDEDDENREVDVALEEIKKNAQGAG